MSVPSPVETALRTLILSLDAFAALKPTPTIRPHYIPSKDFPPGTGARAVIIASHEETHQNDLEGRGGAVSAKVTVDAVSEDFDDAWLIAETMRLNGTDPGTGLAGFAGVVGDMTIQRISVDITRKSRHPYDDASDEGYFIVTRELTVEFEEVP